LIGFGYFWSNLWQILLCNYLEEWKKQSVDHRIKVFEEKSLFHGKLLEILIEEHKKNVSCHQKLTKVLSK